MARCRSMSESKMPGFALNLNMDHLISGCIMTC